MIHSRQKKILILAMRAGEIMLKSGAEIYRVEDTVERICKACKIPYVEVFAMPTGIFVSLDNGDDENDMYTYVKRIRGGETDLYKISDINQFSREFTTTDLTIESGMERLKEIDKNPAYPWLLRLLAASFVASFFCLLFGGNILDFACTFFIGPASYTLFMLQKKYRINYFIRGFICCAVAASLSLAAFSVLPNTHYSIMISATLMIYVPGVALTNSIRDFLSGDMVSGVGRMTEAFIIAISLAAGVGVVLKIWSAAGGA